MNNAAFFAFFLGILVGVIGSEMWRVPAADFCKPICRLCNGSGLSDKEILGG